MIEPVQKRKSLQSIYLKGFFVAEDYSIFGPIETMYMPGGESGISLPFVGWRKEGERVLFRIDYVVYSIL